MVDVGQYLNFAEVAQFSDATVNALNCALKGSTPVDRYVRLLYIVRQAVQYKFTQNPTDASLDATANYMYSLSGGRNITPAVPATPFVIITQPQSQTVSSGTNVTFIVVVGGGTPAYTYQWYFNNSAIGGATSSTYSITPATGANTGQYKVIIHDANGQTLTSVNALLTVTIPTINVYAVPLASDPFPLTVDSYTYTYHELVNATGNIPWTLLEADNDANYWIFKEELSATVKLSYDNGTNISNSGSIPDSVYRAPVVLGSYRYYLTRIPYSYDSNQDTTLKTTA